MTGKLTRGGERVARGCGRFASSINRGSAQTPSPAGRIALRLHPCAFLRHQNILRRNGRRHRRANPRSTDVLAEGSARQIELHRPYGGVVPEMATREHLKNLPVARARVLREARLTLAALDGIGGHGRTGAGLVAAGRPFVRARPGRGAFQADHGVNHLEGHLYSPFLSEQRQIEFPFAASSQRRPHAAPSMRWPEPLREARLDGGRRGG